MAPDRRPTSAKRTDPMFKRPSNHYGRSLELVTPYQRAAQVWYDRLASVRLQSKYWRFALSVALLISSALAVGLLLMAARVLILPWVLPWVKVWAPPVITPVHGPRPHTEP